jgi:hypothetical protein
MRCLLSGGDWDNQLKNPSFSGGAVSLHTNSYQFLRPMSFGWSIVVEQAVMYLIWGIVRFHLISLTHPLTVSKGRSSYQVDQSGLIRLHSQEVTRTYRDSGLVNLGSASQTTVSLPLACVFLQVIYKSTESETLRLHEGSINTKSN